MGDKIMKMLMNVVMLLLVISLMEERSEAAMCSRPSNTYRGLCFRDRNCAIVCQQEGSETGRCSGWNRICRCYQSCAPGGGGGGGYYPPGGGGGYYPPVGGGGEYPPIGGGEGSGYPRYPQVGGGGRNPPGCRQNHE